MDKKRLASQLAIVGLAACASLNAKEITIQDINQEECAPLLWMHKSQKMIEKWSQNEDVYFGLSLDIACIKRKLPDGSFEYFLSRTIENIQEDIDVLNSDFKEANIQFIVKRIYLTITEIPYEKNNTIAHEAINAATKDSIIAQILGHPIKDNGSPNHVDIYYRFDIGLGKDGLAEVHGAPNGCIWICGPTNLKQTLSHEMGHHFGLLHTFDANDDYVEDTPKGPSSPTQYGTDEDKNRMNIMSYSGDLNRGFTKGQIERMQRFACAWLSEETVEKTDKLVNIKTSIQNTLK